MRLHFLVELCNNLVQLPKWSIGFQQTSDSIAMLEEDRRKVPICTLVRRKSLSCSNDVKEERSPERNMQAPFNAAISKGRSFWQSVAICLHTNRFGKATGKGRRHNEGESVMEKDVFVRGLTCQAPRCGLQSVLR